MVIKLRAPVQFSSQCLLPPLCCLNFKITILILNWKTKFYVAALLKMVKCWYFELKKRREKEKNRFYLKFHGRLSSKPVSFSCALCLLAVVRNTVIGQWQSINVCVIVTLVPFIIRGRGGKNSIQTSYPHLPGCGRIQGMREKCNFYTFTSLPNKIDHILLIDLLIKTFN